MGGDGMGVMERGDGGEGGKGEGHRGMDNGGRLG